MSRNSIELDTLAPSPIPTPSQSMHSTLALLEANDQQAQDPRNNASYRNDMRASRTMSISAKVGGVSKFGGTSDSLPLSAVESDLRLSLYETTPSHMGSIDLFDELDMSAPEAIAAKTDTESSRPAIKIINSFIDHPVTNPVSYDNVRHYYRVQHGIDRDPEAPSSWFSSLFSVTFNLTNYRRRFVKFLKSDRRIILFVITKVSIKNLS